MVDFQFGICERKSWKPISVAWFALNEDKNPVDWAYRMLQIDYKNMLAVVGEKRSVNFKMTLWCLKFSKKPMKKIWWISALECKKWLNQKDKSTL